MAQPRRGHGPVPDDGPLPMFERDAAQCVQVRAEDFVCLVRKREFVPDGGMAMKTLCGHARALKQWVGRQLPVAALGRTQFRQYGKRDKARCISLFLNTFKDRACGRAALIHAQYGSGCHVTAPFIARRPARVIPVFR